MLKSFAERILNWFKPVKKPEKNQWVTVSISFVLAVTLWLLVTLNTQSFSRYYSIPVKLTNFPESLQLTHEFPNEMRVLVKGIGIELLYQQVESEQPLEIDFNEYRDRNGFVSRENHSKINQLLQTGLTVVRARPDTIHLDYLRKSNKRVPVELDLALQLPPAYRLVGEPRSEKDSILVIGPKDSLENITHWKTTHYVSNLLTERQVLYVPLDTNPPYQTLPKVVPVVVNPVPFTERTLSVPLTKSYVPRKTGLELDTDSIRIHFLLPMKEYGEIEAEDFRIDADFRKIDLRSDYLIPNILRKPTNVTIQHIEPKLVRYHIIYRD